MSRNRIFFFSIILACHPLQPTNAPWKLHVIDNTSAGADGVKLCDVNGDGLHDIATGWEEGGVTRIYRHPGYDQVQHPWPGVTVGPTTHVEDAFWVDLNGDGATDVVSCCEGNNQQIWVHWAPRDLNNYWSAAHWQTANLPAAVEKMQWMFGAATQLDHQNGLDLIVAGKGPGAEIGWLAAPENTRELAAFQWFSISPVGWVMSLQMTDMDADGDPDILVSDRKGRLRGVRWLENPGVGTVQQQPWPNHFIGAQDCEVMFLTRADFNRDGLEDILVTAKPRRLRVLLRQDASGKVWQESEIQLPANTGTAKAVAVGDVNLDGHLDWVCTCEETDSGKSGVFWLEQRANDEPEFHDISGPRGMKFDRLELIDLDGDGDCDVLTCEERTNEVGLGVIWYENPQILTIKSK